MRATTAPGSGGPGTPATTSSRSSDHGLTLVPISLSQQEIEEFYEGFSNATLWPLYHDLVAKPEFHREWWDSYVTVNQRFADAAAKYAAEDAVVWVQDYQLQLVPAMLRELRPDLRIGFYLHIPFPPAELFSQLPWRRQILEGLLGADLVGFQRSGRRAELRPARAPAGRPQDPPRLGLPARRARRARSAPSRSRSTSKSSRSSRSRERGREAGRPDPARPRPAREGVPGRRPARLHQGHLRTAAGVQRADRRRATSPSRTPSSSRWPRPSRERVDQYRKLRDDIDRLVGRHQR